MRKEIITEKFWHNYRDNCDDPKFTDEYIVTCYVTFMSKSFYVVTVKEFNVKKGAWAVNEKPDEIISVIGWSEMPKHMQD